jgi:hypothetical protein
MRSGLADPSTAVLASLALPLIAGWLVALLSSE